MIDFLAQHLFDRTRSLSYSHIRRVAVWLVVLFWLFALPVLAALFGLAWLALTGRPVFAW